MTPRLHYAKVAPGIYEAMDALDRYLGQASIDEGLLNLIRLRVSQMNGCAYCIDSHWKDLRKAGDTEQRLAALDAWRETPYYSERERAALAWSEAVARIDQGHAPDAVLEETRRQFSEREICDLTLAVATISAWNRLSIAARLVPSSDQPAAPAVVGNTR
jgi:AhpD family alkylhydroperoxidase